MKIRSNVLYEYNKDCTSVLYCTYEMVNLNVPGHVLSPLMSVKRFLLIIKALNQGV